MSEVGESAEQFYKEVLELITNQHIPFLVGGSYAVGQFIPMKPRTKDLDLFCRAHDYPKILKLAKEAGFKTSVYDEKWLAKIIKEEHVVDIIFSSSGDTNPVDDDWFKYASKAQIFGIEVGVVAPEELIWCKSYVQDRGRYDGADVNHLLLHQGKALDWNRLLKRMDRHWELLMSSLLNFRFVYPSERNIVPQWLMMELIDRLKIQEDTLTPKDKLCRGPLLSRNDYLIDIHEKGFTF